MWAQGIVNALASVTTQSNIDLGLNRLFFTKATELPQAELGIDAGFVYRQRIWNDMGDQDLDASPKLTSEMRCLAEGVKSVRRRCEQNRDRQFAGVFAGRLS
jgi:hypothetical protein